MMSCKINDELVRSIKNMAGSKAVTQEFIDFVSAPIRVYYCIPVLDLAIMEPSDLFLASPQTILSYYACLRNYVLHSISPGHMSSP